MLLEYTDALIEVSLAMADCYPVDGGLKSSLDQFAEQLDDIEGAKEVS